MMFVDHVRIFAQAGDGGRGCVSFRREKFVPKGGPDGGDGGRGGDVILHADQHVDQLASLFYESIIRAKNGGLGEGKKMHGRNAPAKTVAVPVGTVVYRGYEKELPAEGQVGSGDDSSVTHTVKRFEIGEQVADLSRPGEEFLLCRGGAGGKGNVHFKSSRNRAPREYTDGTEGERGYFFLELRTIADAALVGYPNAGKSTLLRQISAAQPKVAAYPFTTLHPVIGVVQLDGYRTVTVADIPGLIEGAHRGLGLGRDFLRHITRCRVLLFVVDMGGSEGRSPISDLEALRREIDLYDPGLSQRPWFVVANKMDVAAAEGNLREFIERFPTIAVIPVSGTKSTGIEELKRMLAELTIAQPQEFATEVVSDEKNFKSLDK